MSASLVFLEPPPLQCYKDVVNTPRRIWQPVLFLYFLPSPSVVLLVFRGMKTYVPLRYHFPHRSQAPSNQIHSTSTHCAQLVITRKTMINVLLHLMSPLPSNTNVRHRLPWYKQIRLCLLAGFIVNRPKGGARGSTGYCFVYSQYSPGRHGVTITYTANNKAFYNVSHSWSKEIRDS